MIEKISLRMDGVGEVITYNPKAAVNQNIVIESS